jgi:mono/diheme cytochrome c family protein
MLLITLCVFYIPAAADPQRYSVFAWIMAGARLFAAAFWIMAMTQSGQAKVLLPMFLTDLTFGIVLAILLQLGLGPDKKFSLQHLHDWWAPRFSSFRNFFRSGLLRLAAVSALVLAGFFGYGLWYYLLRAVPDPVIADPEENFKYGVIGLGIDARIPYYLWRVLPGMFRDKLPEGGMASLGLLQEPGHELPVGFSKRQIGYPSIEPNCALCHTSSYRRNAGDHPVIVPGSPAHELDLESFQNFLYESAADPRFTTENVLRAIEKVQSLGRFEKQVYRFVILPAAKRGLLKQRAEYVWQKLRPRQGRGRTDTFNPTKFNVFHMPDDGTIGTVDLPAIWNQRPREGLYLHWDGNNNEITQRNFAAAMAIGATPKSVKIDNFKRVTDYVLDLAPPKFPFPINVARAEAGKPIYEKNCAGCHAFGQPKTGQVTSIDQIGTDRYRLDSFTSELVQRFHAIDEPPFVFSAYRKTDGYSNLPIDGAWLRAPYLHNGSVPTLWDLLQPPERRPKTFYRGSNLYDPVNLGFISSGAEAEKDGFKFDTSLAGNGNQGHFYGTELSESDKRALIEYLKTL